MRQHWKVYHFNFVVQIKTTTITIDQQQLIISPMIWVLVGIIFAQFLVQIHSYGLYQFIQLMVMEISNG